MTKILTNKSSTNIDYPICRPSLDLDFTQEVLDPRITFTRGSIGTRVNRNRLIETVSANQPRFDYDPVTGECKGLLIEESRSNIVLNSTTLSSHTNSSTTTVLTTETTSPDGTSNAYKIIGNSGVKTRESIHTNSFTMNANSSYTASVFLKGTSTRRYAVMWFDNTAPGNAPVEGPYYGASVFIDLLTGTSSNSSVVKMIPYGNGWYRCYLTATVGASNLTTIYLNVSIGSQNGFSDTGNPSQYKYVGDGISGFYYWGPQVEAGAFPTSYIPTTASTVTRSADLASITGTNFSSFYNSSEGTVYANISIGRTLTTAGTGSWTLDNGSFANGYSLYHTNTTSTRLSVRGPNTSSSGTSIGDVTGIDVTKLKNCSIILPSTTNTILSCSNAKFSGNVTSFSSGVTVNRLLIGLNNIIGTSANNYLNGTISRLTYYPRALKPNQLQYLTQ